MNGSAPAMVSVDSNYRSVRSSKSSLAGSWSCSTCTYINRPNAHQCEMCEAPNPNAVDIPVAAIVSKSAAAAAAKSSAASTAASKASLPVPPAATPAPVPVLLSQVSATFKAGSYENGLITACNNLTYDEVLKRRLVGLPRANYDLIMKLKHKASAIFLLNMESKELYGVFEAEGAPALDIEPDAWTPHHRPGSRSSRFPAQCRFTIAADFETPLHERHYRELFARDTKRIRNLTGEEVKKLIKLFQAKSKLRKTAVAPSAAPTAASASAVPVTAASSSGTNSRRGSFDSATGDKSNGTATAASVPVAQAASHSNGSKPQRTVSKIQQTCKRWLADECQHTDETCKYLHVPTICRAFQRGTCPKGSSCPFVHDKVDREHYKHGRSYCQKTAVHADAVAPTSGTAAKPSAASASKTPQKDNLDSILSGLNSWKIAPKVKSEEVDSSQAESQSVEESASEVPDDDGQEFLQQSEEAAEFEQDSAASMHHQFDADVDDGGMTFESGAPSSQLGASSQGLYMDNGLSFVPQAASASAAASWNSYDDPSFGSSQNDGSMFFAPPSQQLVGGASQQSFAPQLPPPEEYTWFTHFRASVVQPALQAAHVRIGPD